MKAEIKWINGAWHGFLSAEGSCREFKIVSCGIRETYEAIEEHAGGEPFTWRVVNNKLVGTR